MNGLNELLGGAWRARTALAGMAMSLCMSLPAHAESHALIMWIGHYIDPRADLPGIELDAQSARKIALAMGVPAPNITELKNEELTWTGMAKGISALVERINAGDKVFIYYTGHGAQSPNVSGSANACSEGIVSHDKQLYYDRELEADLGRLGAKASQVVMMNDSCFSGGTSTKELSRGSKKLTPKFYPGPVSGGKSGTAPDYTCGNAVNKGFLIKNLEVIPRAGAQLLYLAASRDNEIANATPDGSVATMAWAACINDPATDKDRSGSISGEELRVCAQARIDRVPVAQRITVAGAGTLPVSFASTPASADGAAIVPSLALQDIRAGADKAYLVTLTPAKRTLRIGQDMLEFEVETGRDGYLYIFQVGSDGKTFNLLFPNKIDANNRVDAGRHKFPRPEWALKASGPAGTDHLMALLSDDPKSFADLSKQAQVFASVPATRGRTKNLMVVATGASRGSQGRYGASEVVQVTEAP